MSGLKVTRGESSILLVREGATSPIPLFCPVCDLMMRTAEDAAAHRESKCCAACARKWRDSNRSRWASGWRPTTKEVSEEVSARRIVPISLKLEEDT